AQGLRNDGVNIAAPAGAPVRAAQAGVVAYAGDGLEAFGRLILIRHAGGWVSAYAHNAALLVHRGQRVRRGQIIARVGASGFVDRPQLHFELRRGKTPVDPLRHLPRLTADAAP
ncbi:MAG: M23 family metallopeptidase, partial [Alphaproteobacteria bacterium]